MPIYRTELINFTVFERAEFEFSRGINVLIGKNGTGKTHVLKALYAMTEGVRRSYSNNDAVPGIGMKMLIQASKKHHGEAQETDIEGLARSGFFTIFLHGLFNSSVQKQDVDYIKNLIRRGKRLAEYENEALIGSSFLKDGEQTVVFYELSLDEKSWHSFLVEPVVRALPAALANRTVFLPPREVLTMYPGFIALYQQRWLSFDRTYYELCEALSLPLLRQLPQEFSRLIEKLESAIGGHVVLRGERFIIERDGGDTDANLEAEGLRKLAMIVHLIANGSLEPGGFLFWDEPEANMNPKLVVLIRDLLVGLAKAGVQVFIATHDYLLCSELSLFSEYASAEDKDLVKFFCLNKDKHTDPVSVESGDVLADLSHNPIVEEFTAHYEREAKMFAEKH